MRRRATREQLESFFEKALNTKSNTCLLWPYATTRGYAQMQFGEKLDYVHRVVCERTHGKRPSKKHEAAHSCENGNVGCVNNRHVRWRTHQQNMQECTKWKRDGINNGNVKLTEAQVKLIKYSKKSSRVLASKFGVSNVAINNIKLGRSWGHVR